MSDNIDNAQLREALKKIQVDLADIKRELGEVKSEMYSFRDLIGDLIGIYSGKRVRR